MDTATAQLLQKCVDSLYCLRKEAGSMLMGDLPWNKFGVRDPSVLMDAEGRAVLDDAGRLTLFFNARDRAIEEGGVTCIGAATGNQQAGWIVRPAPMLVDGTYAAQGSVLRLSQDHCRLYYSPDTLKGFALASSIDGQNWRKIGDGLILSPETFGIRRMGLPYVRRVLDQWVMVFEGIENGRFHIYLALSADGISWRPGNHGKPIYLPIQGNWDYFGQANPSLYVSGNGGSDPQFLILYNGCSAPHAWDIGVLVSDSLEGPWFAAPRPIVERGNSGEWDGGRLEGARLVEMADQPPTVLYFGLPTTDSYESGRIAFASIVATDKARAIAAEELTANINAERSYNNKLANRYFDVWDNYPIQRFTTEVESRLLISVIPASSRVVLMGSGGGRELPSLLARGCAVTAVDISPQMLEVGRQRYPDANVTWIEADLHQLPSNLENFAAAVCLGAVFNYLRDPGIFLTNAQHALKPGGSLILSVISSQHPSEKSASALLRDGRIRHLYSVAEIHSLLSSTGFDVVSTRGVRFLVDLLPAAWNRNTTEPSVEAEILSKLLIEEAKLIDRLPAEKGKFILIHATARLSDSK